MIKDDEFIRNDGVPITKEEIRALSLSKLNLIHSDIVIDIGCGSGGMTIEMAKIAKKAYAMDNSEDAINTTKANLEKFNIRNCELISGDAKEELEKVLKKLKESNESNELNALPSENLKIFIGGTQNIEEILKIANKYSIKTIVSNTIVVNTGLKIAEILENYGYEIDLINMNVSYGRKIKSGYMMIARNPITIITAKK
ncbi:precorrin-6Y C5,15-methyltransferase (decarboxylating) subunit CbiT [Methanococcus voltae]|uniref:Probable cobalt-precorrin-6B C(15)-methyltransferase (decarboxylating) n=1 Tax=Methanococcus voltae TaxID=2188 RepID=A0A8J7RGK8_METVO|nr:precorrin-6Y C5,15-methyltransferase (decarboxylating) subunit CbiT [Methanococcus voltae]MBP2171915.1 cobalt-precorrin-6B (C15)-methyltransferase [Methanococcus voltae]MBP2201130.1 cobalt-precorrin-6B (C15)-methyltransferase [Methanococcus voltae]